MGFLDTVFPNIGERRDQREIERIKRQRFLDQIDAQAELGIGPDRTGALRPPQQAPEMNATLNLDDITGGVSQGQMQVPTQAGADFIQRQRGLYNRAFPEAAAARVQAQAFPAAPSLVKYGPGDSGVMQGIDPATGQPFARTVYQAPFKPDEITPWQQAQIKHQTTMEDIALKNNANTAARAAETEDRRNRPQPTTYVNRITGNPIRLDPANQSYMDGPNVVSADDLVPVGDFNKEVEKGRSVTAGRVRGEELLQNVTDNPSAFDSTKVNQAKALGYIPFAGDKLANRVFTEPENETRAAVARDAAAIINELYGAALSAGENVRAGTFAPDSSDDLPQLVPKLKSAVSWAKTLEKGILPSALGRAQKQLGATPKPNSPGKPQDMPENARKAKDGKFYSPDPDRPGKYIQW